MLEAIFIIVMIVLTVLAIVFFWLPFGWIVILACALGSDDPNLGACDMAHTAAIIYGVSGLILAVVNSRSIVAWLHYLFVPHPAAPVLRAATGETSPAPLDADALARALVPKDDLPPGFVASNMRRKAERLRERAQAQKERYRTEARLAEEAVEMERERRRLMDRKKER